MKEEDKISVVCVKKDIFFYKDILQQSPLPEERGKERAIEQILIFKNK